MCCCIMVAVPPSPPCAPGDADTVESVRGATGPGQAHRPTISRPRDPPSTSIHRQEAAFGGRTGHGPDFEISACAHATSHSRSTLSSSVSCASVGEDKDVHRYSQAILVLMIYRSEPAFGSISLLSTDG
jgi:hypothetical protein